MKIIGAFLFFLALSPLHAGESAWQTLERLTLKNNNKKIVGEMLYKHHSYKSEFATLTIEVPNKIQLVSESNFEIIRIEPDRIKSGQPAKNPTVAMAWELLLDIRRELASSFGPSKVDFFRDYKNTNYFETHSYYDKPFQVVTLSSSDKKIPFKKLSLYYDAEENLSSLRINFSNGLYGSFSTISESKIR